MLAFLLLAAAARPALADEAERIQQMSRKAMEDYDSLEFDSAKRTLTDCIGMLRSSGLDETALAAKVYTNLGIVYIAGFRDKGRGQQQFERALNIDPSLKLDPAVATPELLEVWNAAVQSLPKKKRAIAQGGQPGQTGQPGQSGQTGQPGQGGHSGKDPETPAAPAVPPEKALQHTPLDEVASGQRVSVYAHPLVSVARAQLFYRGPGQERYRVVPMGRSRKVPGDIVGLIPADATQGRNIQYYLEAYDDGGNVVGRQGSPESPLIISINVSKTPAPAEDFEDPLASLRDKPSTFTPRVYLGLSLGSGGAAIGSGATTEVAWYYNRSANLYEPAKASAGGFIWSGLGLQAELGVFAYQGLSIGAVGRFEAYLNHNADSITNDPMACTRASGGKTPCYGTTGKGQSGGMGMLRLRYQFRRSAVFRPYLHADVGGGVWRGALSIEGSKPSEMGSPFQPTDVCSATYNGSTGGDALPAGCSSIANVKGFNNQDPTVRKTAPERALNRVCPTDGPCTDSVLMGYGALGAGGGFYVGSDRVGLNVDLSMIALVGGQFGFLIDVYAGPQIHF